jgi:hypothetical protein
MVEWQHQKGGVHMIDTVQRFLTWWHSIFAAWDPDRLYSLAFWYLNEDMKEKLPLISSYLLLAVVVSSVICIFHSLVSHDPGILILKVCTIPVALLGMVLLRLATEMSYELIYQGSIYFKEIFLELIPALADYSGIELILKILEVVIAIPLFLFKSLLHLTLTLIGVAPFLGLFAFNMILYKGMGIFHFLADVGGSIILMLGVALVYFGMSVYGALFVLLGGGPIFLQGIREWNFIGSGGTIIRK